MVLFFLPIYCTEKRMKTSTPWRDEMEGFSAIGNLMDNSLSLRNQMSASYISFQGGGITWKL